MHSPLSDLCQRSILPFDFAVRLRVIRRSPDVRHARDANEVLEVLGDELRPVVGNDSRFNARILLFGTFQGGRFGETFFLGDHRKDDQEVQIDLSQFL
jgi:hypothetical protein